MKYTDSDMFYLFTTIIRRAEKIDPSVNLTELSNFDDEKISSGQNFAKNKQF